MFNLFQNQQVWYVNQGRHGTPQSFDVDLDWTAAGSDDRRAEEAQSQSRSAGV